MPQRNEFEDFYQASYGRGGAMGEISRVQFTREGLHFPAPNFSAGPNFSAW